MSASKGYLHRRSQNFGKLPEELLHDRNVSDGAKVLYAHMHWRYGSNCQNWEGQQSMADNLGVKRTTIHRRLKELEDAHWIVIVRRGKSRGQYQTNFYHVFEMQRDCLEWIKKTGKQHGRVAKMKHDRVAKMKHGRVANLQHKPDSVEPDSKSIAPNGAGGSGKEKVKVPKEQLYPMIEALVAAFRLDRDRITKIRWSSLRGVARDLCLSGYEPEHVKTTHRYCMAQGFKAFTEHAIAKHAPSVIKAIDAQTTNGDQDVGYEVDAPGADANLHLDAQGQWNKESE